MKLQHLASLIDSPSAADEWLQQVGIADPPSGRQSLMGLVDCRLPPELLVQLLTLLETHLARCLNPDLAFGTLQRFVSASLNPISLGSLFEREPGELDALLKIFSVSRPMSDLLVRDPAAFELLRLTRGQAIDGGQLRDELRSEIGKLPDQRSALAALRRYRRRETLRIAYGDINRTQSATTVSEQLSFLADAICEAALNYARRQLTVKHGTPLQSDGRPARFAILGVQDLGGREMSYGSPLSLWFLFDGHGKSAGSKPIANEDFFDRLAGDFLSLIQEETELGSCYRVMTRLQPPPTEGRCVVRREEAHHYLDVLGRTRDRQTLIKARTIAGDRDLGDEFLTATEPWIYRRYLSRADVTEIKALKRRIERKSHRGGEDDRDPEHCRGGIRDIQAVVQFLQLLNGCDLPSVRAGNTLDAIQALHTTNCLRKQEADQLSDGYIYLRELQHRLQIRSAELSTCLPTDRKELSQLANSVSECVNTDDVFATYRTHIEQHHETLDRLMKDAFSDAPDNVTPEFDLVLDPNPPDDFIRTTLQPYRFENISAAYQHLTELGTERVQFLSTRRCRHFLSAIATPLLQEIRDTPDPDDALANLCRVSDSLGGKGALWELFQYSPATLKLYVRLCASSPYLSTILTSNPGMLDELMDSLMLERLPSRTMLEQTLSDWCRGASDIRPILHNFKNAQHLNAGVRDILGKEDIRDTTAFLADVAQVCVRAVCDEQFQKQIERYGEPWHEQENRRCELALLAMGKLGGREPNYHSDLDVVFLYETEGTTRDPRSRQSNSRSTSHRHFFSELAQRIAKTINQLGPQGRLYELDTKLQPQGESSQLATSLNTFADAFTEDADNLVLARLSLCRSRTIYGPPAVCRRVEQVIREAIQAVPWQPSNVQRIRQHRIDLEKNASQQNLKRSPGGLVDIDLLVETIQLANAAAHPELIGLGSFDGLKALQERQLLSGSDAEQLTLAYRYLRGVEARLRLLNTSARHDLPSQSNELAKLSYLLGPTDVGPAETSIDIMHRVRQAFNRLLDALLPPPKPKAK